MHDIPWDGRDDSGRQAAGGTYFIRLVWEGREESKRVPILR